MRIENSIRVGRIFHTGSSNVVAIHKATLRDAGLKHGDYVAMWTDNSRGEGLPLVVFAKIRLEDLNKPLYGLEAKQEGSFARTARG